MNHTFTRLFSLGLLCLFGRVAVAQDAEQLTNFFSSQWRRNPVEQLVTFEGQIYTANGLTVYPGTKRFGRIDPETGIHTALVEAQEYYGGSTGDDVLGGLQVLDGKLFGRKQTDQATDLYRIEGDQTIRLTRLIKQPLTRLVAFGGSYYFLVAGRSVGGSSQDSSPGSYTELWRTDGTPEGTALVAELPVVNSDRLLTAPPVLVAGAESLLLSGNTVADQNSSYKSYFLYRPGTGTTRVGLPENSDATSAGLRSFDDKPKEVVYFAGGFYVTGEIDTQDFSDEELHRIEETEATMRAIPGLLRVPVNRSFGADATFAVVGDSLYLHLSDINNGYVLYAAARTTPETFHTVAISEVSAAQAGLVSRGDTLYFGGSTQTAGDAIMRYIPGTGQPQELFNDPDRTLWANLHIGVDVVYAVNHYDRKIWRYIPSLDAVDVFTNSYNWGFEELPYTADLYGNDLIYNGYTAAGGYDLAETEPYILGRDAEQPRVLSPVGPAVPLGITRAYSELADGRLLLRGFDQDVEGSYHVYDPSEEKLTTLLRSTPSGVTTAGLGYLNTIGGQPLFSEYNYDDRQHYIYTVVGDSLVQVVDASISDPLTLRYPYFLSYGPVDIDRQYTQLDVNRYSFTGASYTREQVARLPGWYDGDLTSGEYIQLFRESADSQYVRLLRLDGTFRYDFQVPIDAELVNVDSAGYFYLVYPPEGEPVLTHYSVATSTSLTFTLPEGTTPGWRANSFLLGNRLVFSPYNREGGTEPYVADPATGRIERLANIHPGPAGSGPHRMWQVGDRLFFTADDGTHGTELWRTDGTVVGTRLVGDINPGAGSSAPGRYHLGDSLLYFAATGTSGREIYGVRLDDESVGLIADINPGPASSYLWDILETGSGLYAVAATSDEEAAQLYRLDQRLISRVREDRIVKGTLGLFPNPATGSVTLLAEPGEELQRILLFDSAGRRVRELRTQGERVTVPVHDLSPGLYVAVVRYVSGGRRAAPLSVAR